MLRSRCRKSARHCGAKHISKSKCTKHTNTGPLLEVEMSKKCTPLWREAHFQVKMYKTDRFGPLSDIQMSKKSTPLWRETHFQVKSVKNCLVLRLLKNEQNARVCSSFNYNHQNTTLHKATFHYTTLHHTTLRYTTLHYTTLRYNTFNYATLQL